MRLRLWPVLLVLAAAVVLGACGDGEDAASEAVNPDALDGPVLTDGEQFTTTASGLRYRDLRVGDGATPKAGDVVEVHYTGWLTDGKQFDSSRAEGRVPIKFPLGQGMVIAGWDEGLSTMQVGGHRKLVIPAKLGYGDRGWVEADGTVSIPPGATLVFQVELLSIQSQ